jgi:uncharacterized lipoprotein YmbA
MTHKHAARTFSTMLVSLLVLSGCGALLDTERPPDVRFWLEPLDAGDAPKTSELAVQLEVDVVPGLDSERVLWLRRDARLEQLADARWADNLRDVLDSVLSRSLAAQGLNVVSRSGGPARRCRVKIDVQEFFAYGAAEPDSVRARLAGYTDCGGGPVPFNISERRPVSAEATRVVAALQDALDAMTRTLLAQLNDTAGVARSSD